MGNKYVHIFGHIRDAEKDFGGLCHSGRILLKRLYIKRDQL